MRIGRIHRKGKRRHWIDQPCLAPRHQRRLIPKEPALPVRMPVGSRLPASGGTRQRSDDLQVTVPLRLERSASADHVPYNAAMPDFDLKAQPQQTPLCVMYRESFLCPNDSGTLKLLLLQTSCGLDALTPDGESRLDFQRGDRLFRCSGDGPHNQASSSMGQSDKYGFTEHKNSTARLQSAVELIKLLLQPNPRILPEHRQELLSIALWKITEAESTHKHRTRFCSRAVFVAPDCECRHDHVFQRAVMVQDLLHAGPADVEGILKNAIACTITKDEHLSLNAYAHLDGWERYRAAGIAVIDSKTGEVFNFPASSV